MQLIFVQFLNDIHTLRSQNFLKWEFFEKCTQHYTWAELPEPNAIEGNGGRNYQRYAFQTISLVFVGCDCLHDLFYTFCLWRKQNCTFSKTAHVFSTFGKLVALQRETEDQLHAP